MPLPKLSYFDFPSSRGEECRLAFVLAGVEFEDNRVKGPDWPALKASTPFGAMPVLEIDGAKLSQSNAILGYIGRKYGLLPDDPWEAAHHMQLLAACEEIRHKVVAVLAVKEEDGKIEARRKLASDVLKPFGANVEKLLGDGPFVGGDAPSVADIKLYMIVRWFASGSVDHVPDTVFGDNPKLMGLYEAVKNHPKVLEWYAD